MKTIRERAEAAVKRPNGDIFMSDVFAAERLMRELVTDVAADLAGCSPTYYGVMFSDHVMAKWIGLDAKIPARKE
jgi:hypothetical protein